MTGTLTDLAPDATRVVIAGDWHGNMMWVQGVVRRAAQVGASIILQVGDAAFRWPGPTSGKFDRKINTELSKHDLQVVFIDGNHDAHDRLAIAKRDGHGFGIIQDRIRYAPRGQRWYIDGVSFGALGGAYSIDYRHRTPGRNWWPHDEEVHQGDVDALGDDPLDVLLTHDVPSAVTMTSDLRVPPETAARAQVSRDLLQHAVERTRPRVVLAGHWHQRRTATIQHAHGETRVEALACDGMPGDAVILELDGLGVRPLPKLSRLR